MGRRVSPRRRFAGFVRGHYLNSRRRAFREGRRPEVPLTPTFDVPAPEPEDGASEDELSALQHCLSRLPPRELAAVRLRYFEERSSADIAAVLGSRKGTRGGSCAWESPACAAGSWARCPRRASCAPPRSQAPLSRPRS
jgi:hypothetical protein